MAVQTAAAVTPHSHRCWAGPHELACRLTTQRYNFGTGEPLDLTDFTLDE